MNEKIEIAIKNTIRVLLEHDCTEKEFASAVEYMVGTADEEITLLDLYGILDDWKHDCCTQCEECGRWFLEDEAEYDDVYNKKFCSYECWEEYDAIKQEKPEISQHI